MRSLKNGSSFFKVYCDQVSLIQAVKRVEGFAEYLETNNH
ncbi:hypothetical protein HMPREF9499_00616 [Enterococcus faecalis TX0012]|nr:hypothetical protein HMPREF9499_00616 [Enterococcus faecalis TX0012]